MRALFALLALVGAGPAGAVTELDISVGVEYFTWEEFSDSGDKLLDETGSRKFVGIVASNPMNQVWSSDFGGRLYSGTVDYDGENTAAGAVASETDYNGFELELGFQRHLGKRRELGRGVWLLRFGLGVEQWRRSVLDSHLTDGTPVAGYVEHYNSNYATLGASYRQQGLWGFSVGAKAPFYTTVERDNGTDPVTLNPEGRLSLFAEAELSLAERWSVALDYDSYRFAKSDTVEGLTKSESTQDTFSVQLHYRF